MSPYRLYYLDRYDHIIKVDEREFADDVSALAHAIVLTRTHDMEVWQGERLVGRRSKGACRKAA